MSSLDGGTKVFFSRRLQGPEGEDLVEKQNAEQGLMPLVGNEYGEYGYEAENRHFTRCFLDGVQPEPDFHAGREVTELLMTCYMSAEEGRVISWKPEAGRPDTRAAVSPGSGGAALSAGTSGPGNQAREVGP